MKKTATLSSGSSSSQAMTSESSESSDTLFAHPERKNSVESLYHFSSPDLKRQQMLLKTANRVQRAHPSFAHQSSDQIEQIEQRGHHGHFRGSQNTRHTSDATLMSLHDTNRATNVLLPSSVQVRRPFDKSLVSFSFKHPFLLWLF